MMAAMILTPFERAAAGGAFPFKWLGVDAAALHHGKDFVDRYVGFLDTEMDLIMGTAPRDGDQDGVIEEAEQVRYRSRELRR